MRALSLFSSWRPRGHEISKEDMEALSQASIAEARIKIKALEAFYKNPCGDQSQKWLLPAFSLQYLQNFKIEGQKRKNKTTENILHEVDPLHWVKGLFQADILPPEVTYEIVDGKHQNLSPDERPISRLFSTIAIHDLDEDFPEVDKEHYIAYMTERVKHEDGLSDEEKKRLIEIVTQNADAMCTLSFGRKYFDASGKEKKEITHDGNLQKYCDDLSKDWAACSAKGPDRVAGLISRYGEVPDYFTIEQDDDYREETRIIFTQRHLLLQMKERYPELSGYFDVINANLMIALNCFDVMTTHHPSRLKQTKNAKIDSLSAQIFIPPKTLDLAFRGSKYLELGSAHPLQRMIEGFEFEAKRHTELVPLVQQMQNQIEPHLQSYKPMVFHPPSPNVVEGVDLER